MFKRTNMIKNRINLTLKKYFRVMIVRKKHNSGGLFSFKLKKVRQDKSKKSFNHHLLVEREKLRLLEIENLFLRDALNSLSPMKSPSESVKEKK